MERRERKRSHFWLPVQVDGLPTGIAVGHDASENGLMLVCSATLPVGTSVRLAFPLPPGGSDEVTASATVVRVGPNDEDPDGLWPHKMAVRFDAPVEKLEAYLMELARRREDDD